MVQNSKNSNDFLADQLQEIESLIPKRAQAKPTVSKVDISWHLVHMLKVINGIYDALYHSDPKQYKADINVTRTVIFTIGVIPRGRGKAPKSVRPTDNVSTEEIYKLLKLAGKNLLALNTLEKDQFFKHYIFGMLNRDKAKRFIEIHTNHHLKIARDIDSK